MTKNIGRSNMARVDLADCQCQRLTRNGALVLWKTKGSSRPPELSGQHTVRTTAHFERGALAAAILFWS
jgi:hypothetical protein